MADRYWVGGTGSWSQIAHWSASSGGTGGETVPTATDNVFFDINSFTGAGQVVTASSSANCFNMDWTGATNIPEFVQQSVYLTIYGSLTFITNMVFTQATWPVHFKATTTGHSITTSGKNVRASFIGDGGGWTLQDNLNTGNTSMGVSGGTLNTNNKTVTCGGIYLDNYFGYSRTLNLGSSTVNLSGIFNATDTGLTINAGTSIINMLTANTFNGGGYTYSTVDLQASTAISGSNVFGVLTITAGTTISLTAGTTQTITTLTANGTEGNLITLQSSLTGSPATLSKSSGSVEVSYCSIKDITATGGAAFNAVLSTDLGGNTGWNFFNSFKVKIGGAWKNCSAAFVKIGGAWKNVPKVYTKIGGAWKSQ